ncbi:hypothetical protein SDC9_05521 [bioreactor metagenome]|uniref:Uncharacterized protein n=1 Tax=bioreactor metagenome TaxID=1076179 RepID=A0A644SZA8_9ZZZZ
MRNLDCEGERLSLIDRERGNQRKARPAARSETTCPTEPARQVMPAPMTANMPAVSIGSRENAAKISDRLRQKPPRTACPGVLACAALKGLPEIL